MKISCNSTDPDNLHLCLAIQSCLTLCNLMDCSPPGTSVCGDSAGKNTGVGCHALLQGILPTKGSNPGLLADSLPVEPPGKPRSHILQLNIPSATTKTQGNQINKNIKKKTKKNTPNTGHSSQNSWVHDLIWFQPLSALPKLFLLNCLLQLQAITIKHLATHLSFERSLNFLTVSEPGGPWLSHLLSSPLG